MVGPISPSIHKHAQIKVVIYGVIVEFFSLDLITRVSETYIEPVQDIENADGLREQRIVYLLSLDDIQGQQVLQLHDILVLQLKRKHT